MASMLRMAREDLKEIRGCNTDSCNYNGGGTENVAKVDIPENERPCVFVHVYMQETDIYIYICIHIYIYPESPPTNFAHW